ncbi:MAG: hypothetical protein HYX38_27010 [Rhodospirillales bacterium]|nr:hypothetical protein [Rhodospirillales bacterium]
MVRTKLDLSGEEKIVRSVLLAMFAAAAASILLTKQTGVDYLYYYLPVSDYLFSQGMPRAISPSVLDAPFGYPQAEYLLLGATAIFGDYRIYAIKLIQCLKVAAVFWLSFRLAVERSDGNGFLLPAALIAPSATVFFSVYSTDINSIIGLLATLLILTGRERSVILWSLVSYAALSKYTFWLFLPPLYLLLWRAQTLRWISLLPLVLILWHLASNLYFFGNPVFPVGARPDPALPDDMARHLMAWSKPNSEWLLYIAAGFMGAGGALAVLPGLPGYWYVVSGLYVAGWALAMQPDSASDTGRFLLPVSIGAACLARPPRVMPLRLVLLYALVLGLCLIAFVDVRRETPVYYLLLAAFAVAAVLARAPKPWRFASYAVVLVTFLVYSAARIHLKFDVSGDLGYSEYRQQIEQVEAAARNGVVITDFPRLPHALRLNPNVVLWGSDVYGPLSSRTATTGTFDCSGNALVLIGSPKFLSIMQRVTFDHCRSIGTIQLP